MNALIEIETYLKLLEGFATAADYRLANDNERTRYEFECAKKRILEFRAKHGIIDHAGYLLTGEQPVEQLSAADIVLDTMPLGHMEIVSGLLSLSRQDQIGIGFALGVLNGKDRDLNTIDRCKAIWTRLRDANRIAELAAYIKARSAS